MERSGERLLAAEARRPGREVGERRDIGEHLKGAQRIERWEKETGERITGV